MQHVYLTGLPGCGKTTLGARAARALGLPFYDMDEYIQKMKGRTIAELFAEMSEAAFRQIESEALADIAQNAPGVVATGGGAPMSPRNAPILREGFVIFIDRPPEEIAKTVDIAFRPLLPDIGALYALSAARRAAYERIMNARVRSETIESGIKEILAIVIGGGVLNGPRGTAVLTNRRRR